MVVRATPSRRHYFWSFLRGMVMAEFLLLATWNHGGYSYLSWVRSRNEFTPLMAVAGIALLIAHIAMLRMAYVALGPIGVMASLIAIWLILLACSTLGLLDLRSLLTESNFWIFVAAWVLSAGINWARFQYRLSGQRGVLKAPP
jgi:hypothetical protein